MKNLSLITHPCVVSDR